MQADTSPATLDDVLVELLDIRKLLAAGKDSDDRSASSDSSDFTPEDIAKRLQCSVRHIRRMLDGSQLPGVYRVGRLIRLRRDVIEKWLAEGASSKSRQK